MPSDHSSSSHSSSSSDSSWSSSSDYSSSSYSGSDYNDYRSDYHDYGSRDYDERRYNGGRSYGREYSSGNGILFAAGVGVIFAVILFGISIKEEVAKQYSPNSPEQIAAFSEDDTFETTAAKPDERSYLMHPASHKVAHDSIFVDEIKRTCKWDEESENYYDVISDCYFWLNDTVNPPIWQYWYEKISSNYKDYGWMEYDYEEDQWYIEQYKDYWIKLSQEYDTSKLWHLEEPKDGRYKGMDSINITKTGDGVYKVSEGTQCKYIEAENNYYDERTGCHFYYDSMLRPGEWVYWFEDYGWMSYDESTQDWYRYTVFLNGPGWEQVPHEWKDSKLWHISSK